MSSRDRDGLDAAKTDTSPTYARRARAHGHVEDVLRCPDCISHMEIESVGDADYITQYHSDGCPWLAAFKAKTDRPT